MVTLLFEVGRVLAVAIPVLLFLFSGKADAQTPTVVIAQDSIGRAYFKPIPQIDSVTTLGKLITTLIASSFIHVTSNAANLDTGKVYSIEGAGMTTLTLPSYSTLGSSGITILGTGSGLYKVHPASGQQLVSPNGMAATNGDITATNALCAMVLRPNGNNQWKSTLTTGSYTYNTYKTLNAVGSQYIYPVINTINALNTETEIFRDTIFGNTFPLSQDYGLEGHINITQPAISATTITLKYYFGNSSVSVINAGGLTASVQSGTPLVFYFDMVPKGNASQIFCANVQQPFPVLNLTSSNTNYRQNFSEDATTDKIVRITITLGGILGSNSVSTDFIKRNLF